MWRRCLRSGRSYSVTKVLIRYMKTTCGLRGFQDSPPIYSSCSSVTRLFSTAVSQAKSVEETSGIENEHPKEKPKKRSGKQYVTQSEEILQYLQAKEAFTLASKLMPRKFFKKKRTTPEGLYIADENLARQIVDAVKLDSANINKCLVVEINPGLGLISEELVKAGFNKLQMFESCGEFIPRLTELQEKYPDQVHFIMKDFLTLWKLAYKDKMDCGSRVSDILSLLPSQQWEEDPVVKIIGATPTLHFIKYIIYSVVFQTGIAMQGRPELFMIVPSTIYQHLTCNHGDGYMHYRATTILFQLLFEWKFLMKLPREAFFPWETVHLTKKLRKVCSKNSDFLYLMKMVPRRDLYENVVEVDKLKPLWYFVRHHFWSRKRRIIPQLEQWIPGCGPRLVIQGMNIFTQFGDLSPNEVLTLFNDFSSWPEFPDSPFLTSMETSFLKMEHISDMDKEIPESSIEDVTEEDEETVTHLSETVR